MDFSEVPVIVCGVDIKSKQAFLALVQKFDDDVSHLPCDTKKLRLADDRDADSLVIMKASIEAFALQNKISAFIIKSRQATGVCASGGITFKIETLFQLSSTPVIFISPLALSKFAKSNLGGSPLSVLSYQTDAYGVGACYVSKV